jgi:GxxExxY protein
MDTTEITRLILEAAYKVHSALGPGLLESSYQACLAFEIRKKGMHVETEVALPLVYEDIKLDCGYRIDMLIENCVIIELKVVDALNDVHLAQVLTYLKFSHKKVGLLINFNVKSLKDGIRRVVL